MVNGIDDAAAALERGGIVAFPTETVWGIGCRLDRPDAIGRIFELKRRPEDKLLQVLLPDPAAIAAVAVLTPGAADLARRFMPGPVTLVLPALDTLPDLGSRAGTVGVRVPDHPAALALLERAGPMPATSANRSGEPTPATCEGVRGVFGDGLDAYLDAPPDPRGVPSTVIDLAHDRIAILREGAVSRAAVEEALGRPIPGPA